MTAIRIIDDHLELANIGTKTHAQIEGHIQGIGNYAFPSTDGGANQILETDGAGILSWVNKPANFSCSDLNACSLSDIGIRSHSQLTNIGASDHHIRYTDAEAIAAADVDNKIATHTAISNAHHDKYTDAEAIAAVKGNTDAAHIYNSGSVSIPNNDYYYIDWNVNNDIQVEFNYGSMYNAANTDRLTIQKAGIYFIIGKVRWDPNTSGLRNLNLRGGADGTTVLAVKRNYANLGNLYYDHDVFSISQCAVGDIIRLNAYQNSGNPLTLTLNTIQRGLWAFLLR